MIWRKEDGRTAYDKPNGNRLKGKLEGIGFAYSDLCNNRTGTAIYFQKNPPYALLLETCTLIYEFFQPVRFLFFESLSSCTVIEINRLCRYTALEFGQPVVTQGKHSSKHYTV